MRDMRVCQDEPLVLARAVRLRQGERCCGETKKESSRGGWNQTGDGVKHVVLP